MRRKILCAAALCFACAALPGRAAPQATNASRPASSAILSEEAAKRVVSQCSREAPRHIDGVWIPAESDIQQMERHMDQLVTLESKLCCGSGKIAGSLSDYHIQYAGIVIAGHRLIYLNAIPARRVTSSQKMDNVAARMFCDGGKSFWGAVYDPETQTFRDLAFNGIA